MNKKVSILIIVVVMVALVTLAIIYAPNMLEAMLRFHRIPQH
jgi:hypothetical protein